MKTKNKERRVINLDKESFDTIKKYCDDNALNMTKWLTKLANHNININDEVLRHLICEAIGEASMCWDPIPTGVFESTRALEISNRLFKKIKGNK